MSRLPTYTENILSFLTPAGMWATFERLCAERGDVRTTRFVLASRARVLEWMHSVGVCAHECLAAFVPPIPPRGLRHITAAPDAEEFLWTGLVDLATFLSSWEVHRDSPLGTPARVLDFGCGCGRLLRFLCDKPTLDVVGSDVNGVLVAWCKEHLRGVNARVNEIDPPLPLEASSFDWVYSLSIFTHLNESRSAAWRRELGRVLRPGGIAILTTSGIPALRTILDSAAHQAMFSLTHRQVEEILGSFDRTRFIHRQYDDATLRTANAGSDYGNAFIHPEYVREHWNDDVFQVLEHVPAGLRGWQDIVVLRRW